MTPNDSNEQNIDEIMESYRKITDHQIEEEIKLIRDEQKREQAKEIHKNF